MRPAITRSRLDSCGLLDVHQQTQQSRSITSGSTFPACFFAHQTKEGLNRGLTSAADLYCADADRAKPEWVGDSHMILGCINTPPKLKKSVLGIPLKQKKAKKVAVPVAMDMPAPIVAEDANAEVGWQRLCLISHNGCTMALPKSQGGIDEDDEGAEKEEMEAEEDSDEELGGQSHHPVSSSLLKSPSPFLFEDQLANTATSNWPVFDEFYTHLGADVVGIQEARVPGQERMDHKSAKFVYFFGVGLAVRRKWAAYTQVVYVSDRIIWARIQLGAQLLFVVCAYAPSQLETEDLSQQRRDQFYADLKKTMTTIALNANCKGTAQPNVVILGDFNAQVGTILTDDIPMQRVLGSHNSDSVVTASGNDLLSFALSHELQLASTFFLPACHQWIGHAPQRQRQEVPWGGKCQNRFGSTDI